MITVAKQPQEFSAYEPQEREAVDATGGSTPLARSMNSVQRAWLLDHLCTRSQTLFGGMSGWVGKMAKWERQSEEDYSDRKGAKDPVNDSSEEDIFAMQNDTLGTAGGFYDFHFSQVKNQIFGTRPWLAATPEGKADSDLADVLTKHAQWKLNQSNVEMCLIDALKVSTWGGTAFVKASYRKEVDAFIRTTNVAWDLINDAPFQATDGTGHIETMEALLEAGGTEETAEWREMDIEDAAIAYANASNHLVDYKDIAFETTAPELSLDHTDVFVKFRIGLLDAIERFEIPKEKQSALLAAALGYGEEARAHRDESERMENTHEEISNPTIRLIEGFARCALKPGGPVVRIHAIFSEDLHALLRVDYLANTTPGGMLPVFPVRINRIPARIFGKGYFEKYENANNAIDRQYNLITWRNRQQANVYTGIDTSVLFNPEDEEDLSADDPIKLKPDKKIADLFSFTAAPDNNSRSENLLNSVMQMIQMRSGITSAAQGEMKGVPSANTATGTRDLMSRGETITKAPMDEQTEDIREIVEFDVALIYANLDHDETFAWGEGREKALFTLKAGDVAGMRANVTLSMTQANSARRLDEAMKAISIIQSYIAIPEMEKQAVRPAFAQALASLGFHNADDVIRPAAADPAGILALLPPDLVPIVQQALAAAGMIAPSDGAAPVLESDEAPVASPA